MKLRFHPKPEAMPPCGGLIEAASSAHRPARVETLRPPLLHLSSAVLWLALALVLCGCARPGRWGGIGWTDRHGVHHALILGFGAVSFTNGPVSAQDVRAVGLVLDGGFSAGWVQKHRVEINPNQASNAVVAIKATPFGMTVKNFDFRLTNALFNPQLNSDTP